MTGARAEKLAPGPGVQDLALEEQKKLFAQRVKATGPLADHQAKALTALAIDPTAHVEAGTLGFLRRRGLVEKRQERFERGGRTWVRTTSPLTDAGREELACARGAK